MNSGRSYVNLRIDRYLSSGRNKDEIQWWHMRHESGCRALHKDRYDKLRNQTGAPSSDSDSLVSIKFGILFYKDVFGENLTLESPVYKIEHKCTR